MLTLLVLALSLCCRPALAANALLFSRTTGYRHESIPAAISAIKDMSGSLGMPVTASEDPTLFTNAGLSQFDLIIFLLKCAGTIDARLSLQL